MRNQLVKAVNHLTYKRNTQFTKIRTFRDRQTEQLTQACLLSLFSLGYVYASLNYKLKFSFPHWKMKRKGARRIWKSRVSKDEIDTNCPRLCFLQQVLFCSWKCIEAFYCLFYTHPYLVFTNHLSKVTSTNLMRAMIKAYQKKNNKRQRASSRPTMCTTKGLNLHNERESLKQGQPSKCSCVPMCGTRVSPTMECVSGRIRHIWMSLR